MRGHDQQRADNSDVWNESRCDRRATSVAVVQIPTAVRGRVPVGGPAAGPVADVAVTAIRTPEIPAAG